MSSSLPSSSPGSGTTVPSPSPPLSSLPNSNSAVPYYESTSTPTLKVMRLQKPKLHTPTAGEISSSSSCSMLSTGLCLPDSFGQIAVGETFSAYLGALNTSTTAPVKQLKVVAQLQTPSQRWQLAAPRFDSSNSNMNSNHAAGDTSGSDNGLEIPPLDVVDSIVSHGPLIESGQHILRVEVSYLHVDPNNDGGSSSTKSIRKFYRFQVTNPIKIIQPVRNIWRCGDQSVFVEVEIANITGNNSSNDDDTEGMTISSANFEPMDGLIVESIGGRHTPNDMKPKSASQLFDNCGRLEPGSTRRYVFQLKRQQQAIQDSMNTSDDHDYRQTTTRGIAAGDDLGRPVFTWTKSCGEMGRIQGDMIICPELPVVSSIFSDVTTNNNVLPETIMNGGGGAATAAVDIDTKKNNGGTHFVSYVHGGGCGVSVDVATKMASNENQQTQPPRFGTNSSDTMSLPKWFPVTVEPINPPTTIIAGVPTLVPFMVVNHSDQPLRLQIQFALEHMQGIAVCGPSSINLRDNTEANGGSTTVDVRLIGFQPGLATLSGCSVIDLATGSPIYQLPQFQTMIVSK